MQIRLREFIFIDKMIIVKLVISIKQVKHIIVKIVEIVFSFGIIIVEFS